MVLHAEGVAQGCGATPTPSARGQQGHLSSAQGLCPLAKTKSAYAGGHTLSPTCSLQPRADSHPCAVSCRRSSELWLSKFPPLLIHSAGWPGTRADLGSPEQIQKQMLRRGAQVGSTGSEGVGAAGRGGAGTGCRRGGLAESIWR